MKFDAYQMVTDRICSLMEQGFIPWDRPWALAKTVAWSGVDGHTYSLLNQFLLADPKRKYADIDELFSDIAGEWVTFKQAEDRGGKIRKGEHGRKVVYFQMLPIMDKDQPEKVEKIIPLLKVFTVFKLSQCEGIDQKFHKDAGTLYDFNPDQTADDVANDYISREGIRLNIKSGNKACYSPVTDTVTLPLPEQFQNSAEYYSTLFHELTHSTGHPNRLDRLSGNSFGNEGYSTEELVAEIGSASIMATLGIENEGTFRNSTAYIQNWLKALRNDKRMIVTATSRAEKAIRLILNINDCNQQKTVVF